MVLFFLHGRRSGGVGTEFYCDWCAGPRYVVRSEGVGEGEEEDALTGTRRPKGVKGG